MGVAVHQQILLTPDQKDTPSGGRAMLRPMDLPLSQVRPVRGGDMHASMHAKPSGPPNWEEDRAFEEDLLANMEICE